MAGLGARDILRNITALEQLIEEINFQRAKEMRQCLMSKDTDTSFVIVHGTTYWTDLFVRHFLFQTDRSTDADDLLFFIRKKQVRGSRYVPKYQTEVEVYRKDSRKLPIGDPDVDWEETVYLNLIIHQFDYTLTLAVCTRTSPKELQVLKRHSQKVYASPSRRRMDTKGEVEEITYPNVCFHVDNFDEVFADMLVRDGEMVCVELVAADHGGSRQAVIFLGSIRYDALKRVYDTRASLSSKVAQRMMMGLFSGSSNQRIEFVRMKGPQGKGHAEMAVTKPKGSGVETPTSEPGVSLTDLWDSDWEDEPEDRFLYRHQRRLSDPSANFNTFINSGWVSKAEGKSRSENEGLDNFANGLYEIESGDVRDEACSCRCCSVIACRKLEDDETGVFNEGLCRKCEHFHGKQPSKVDVDSSITAIPEDCAKPITTTTTTTTFGGSLADGNGRGRGEEAQEAGETSLTSCFTSKDDQSDLVIGVEASELMGMEQLHRIKEDKDSETTGDELSQEWNKGQSLFQEDSEVERPDSPSESDPFLTPEVTCVNPRERGEPPPPQSTSPSMKKREGSSPSKKGSRLKRFGLNKKRTPGSAVRVTNPAESENLSQSAPEFIPMATSEETKPEESSSFPCDRIPSINTQPTESTSTQPKPSKKRPTLASGPTYFRSFSVDSRKLDNYLKATTKTSTVLIKSKSMDDVEAIKKKRLRRVSIPFRVTQDGTMVYFPCDTKLDDGAYNPLWTTKGFTQTFHFWKETRRAQSIPLNAYLTYVTLPWFTIITVEPPEVTALTWPGGLRVPRNQWVVPSGTSVPGRVTQDGEATGEAPN